jgi:DNA-binding NarL/FixJ family response regulator
MISTRHESKSIRKKINVWIVDDSEIFCKAVVSGLADNLFLRIQRIFGSSETLLQSLKEEPDVPSVILLDVEMPGMGGLGAIARIRKLSPETCIIMLSCHDDEQYVRGAIRKGASGYLLKPGSASEIENAVKIALAGVIPIDKGAISRLMQIPNSDDVHKVLTPREWQVFRLIAEDLTRKEIAQRLFISTETVHFHLENIYFKLGIHDKRELAQKASEVDLSNINSHS